MLVGAINVDCDFMVATLKILEGLSMGNTMGRVS